MCDKKSPDTTFHCVIESSGQTLACIQERGERAEREIERKCVCLREKGGGIVCLGYLYCLLFNADIVMLCLTEKEMQCLE